jgi:Lrp/AsnC family transcriptional regulator, leucine-responsive regulatory protein
MQLIATTEQSKLESPKSLKKLKDFKRYLLYKRTMNRSRYVPRQIDSVDRAIIAALWQSGRITVRELAARIGLSSPSVTERIYKLQDAGAIRNYTIAVDGSAFGLCVAAHVQLRAIPGEVNKVMQMLIDTPEVIEADRVTGQDCFFVKIMVKDIAALQEVVDRFLPYASTDTAIVQSSPVARRLPKF